MRILFITDNFPPEVNAPATRTYEHARLWAAAGAKVTVLTCAPNFPQGKLYPGYKNALYRREMMDGIEVVRLWSYITANEGFLKRVIDYVSFAGSAALAGLFQRFDVIVATSPQFFTTWAALFISIARRRPWVFELRDLWPASLAAVGAVRHKRLLRVLERIELFLYRRATAVIANAPGFKLDLAARGIDPAKIHVVTNGANLVDFQARPKDPALVRSLGLEGKFVVGYIGTHGMAHGLEFIVETAAAMARQQLCFLFIGDGAEKANVRQRAAALGLGNALFLDSVPKELVPAYLSVTDISLIPLRRSDTFKTVIPSKIFECAAMGKPILLGVEGHAQALVEGHGAGLCFRPEDAADFRAKLSSLMTDADLYARCREGCFQLARAFDRKRLAGEMLSILTEVAASRPGFRPGQANPPAA